MPRVSVVMPVYNGEKFVSRAIGSILNQTFRDFEFVIIDDGSTDGTAEILDKFASNHDRITLITSDSNLGIVKSLNIGLDAARGEYIARIDADAESLPERLAMQVEFMDQNPDVGILGTGYRVEYDDGRPAVVIRHPAEDALIRWRALFSCPFCHPSVMLRSYIFKNNDLRYDIEFQDSEDFDLWVRALEVTKGANLDGIHTIYHRHPVSVGEVSAEAQSSKHYRIMVNQLARHTGRFMASMSALSTLRAIDGTGGSIDIGKVDQAAQLWSELFTAFMAIPASDYDRRLIRSHVINRTVATIFKADIPGKCRIALLRTGLESDLLYFASRFGSRALRRLFKRRG